MYAMTLIVFLLRHPIFIVCNCWHVGMHVPRSREGVSGDDRFDYDHPEFVKWYEEANLHQRHDEDEVSFVVLSLPYICERSIDVVRRMKQNLRCAYCTILH